MPMKMISHVDTWCECLIPIWYGWKCAYFLEKSFYWVSII